MMRTLALLSALLMLGCFQPQPSYSGASSSSSSKSSGCHKGYRCGNSCIAHSKSCHGGSTYKKRRK